MKLTLAVGATCLALAAAPAVAKVAANIVVERPARVDTARPAPAAVAELPMDMTPARAS